MAKKVMAAQVRQYYRCLCEIIQKLLGKNDGITAEGIKTMLQLNR